MEPGSAKSISESLAEFGTTPNDFARIFGAMNVGLVIQQADYSITACNAAAERILGLTADQIAGRTSQDPRWRAIREDGSPFVGDEHPAVVTLKTGQPLRDVLMGVETPDGARRWISINSDPILGADGVASAVVTTFADITEEREARTELALRHDLENTGFAATQLLIGLRGDEFTRGVEAALGAVAEVIGADRASVLFLVDDRSVLRCTHEWVAPGVPLFDRHAASMPMRDAEALRARSGAYDSIDLLLEDSDSAASIADRVALEARGASAALVFPMHSARGFVGLARFDWAEARSWAAAVRPELRAFVDGLTNFIENLHLESTQHSIEARYRLIADENPVGIVETTPEGVCEYVNARMARMIGRPSEELVGTRVSDWIDAESWARLAELALEASAGREATAIEVRPVRPDGAVFWAVARCTALRDAHGVVTGIIGTAEDITKRKEAEEALRFSEERFRAIVQNASDIITILDADGAWRYSSPAGNALLGWPEGYDPEGGVFSLVHPDDVEIAARAFAEVREGSLAATEPVVFRVRHTDGHYISLETTGQNLVDDPAVNGILLVSRDVTDRLRDQEELATARDAALAALQAKREFIAVVSHELRTPMHAVLGLSELLSSSPLNEEQRLYIESIERSVRSLSHVVDDILDYTRAEAGRLDLHPQTFSLRSVVADVVTLFTPVAAEKHLALGAVVDDDVPANLSGDPDRVRQLLTNLVGNAVKYTDAGSVGIEIGVAERSDRHVTVRLAVRDTGLGIPAEQLDRLFEPFEQGEGATWRRHGGTGLGLAICRQLVELMDGAIAVESTVGFGSEFTATVRLAPVEAPRMAIRVSVPRRSTVGRRQPRILVVEDNEVNQLLVDRQLSTLDYEAIVVPDGPTALDRLRESSFDAVLLDVQLPGMDGLDVARKFRSEEVPDGMRTPVIAMTASAMAGDRDACLAAGMDDYLAKPVGIDALRAMLDRWVHHRQDLPTVEPATPGGSLESLASSMGGDRTTVTCMAEAFLDDLPRRREAIAGAADAGAFAAAAHTLASASAALSLTGLFNACRAAEQAAKQGQPFDRETHERAIEAAITRSVPTLEDWLAAER